MPEPLANPPTMVRNVSPNPVTRHFTDALDTLIAQMKQDRSILAALLCGSLSHDTVWAKSDIDLALITIDDSKIDKGALALNANGVNVHAFLMSRSDFRKTVEGAMRNSFTHSLLAKGRLLYTHDETVARLCERLGGIGERDTRTMLLSIATHTLPSLYKARKWLVTRGDLEYTALWILHAADSLARIEVVNARMLADREVLPQATKLNPEFFQVAYSDLLNKKKTQQSVTAALEAAEHYLAQRAPRLFGPILDHLQETGEARSCTEIDDHFHKHFSLDHVSLACEYLADQGLIQKVSLPVHLTKRSNIQLEELAFVHLGDSF